MHDFTGSKVLVGVCGGVAAYKTAVLVRALTSAGACVRVVLTPSALNFVGAMTFQALSGNDVRVDVFDPQAERAMGHIELARWADFVVIAPASANFIAKMTHGLADNLLLTLLLVTAAPVFICPAMNQSMFNHPATQSNIQILQQRGIIIIGPDCGVQACGDYGWGRMAHEHAILSAVRLYQVRGLLTGKHVLITAGPTREAIDPVRYLSNNSSGKMGYALAEAALMAGATVTLISGPTTLNSPVHAQLIQVTSAQEMLDQVMLHLQPGMVVIGAAAVADYTPQYTAQQKIKKQSSHTFDLNLSKTQDILAGVVATGKASYVVGFAAETHDMIEYAQDKLIQKGLDMILANMVGAGQGFDVDDNQVVLITAKKQIELPLMHKTRLAGKIISQLAEFL